MGFAAVSAGLAFASTAMSVAGAISKGNADAAAAGRQAEMQQYQATVARNNQVIANQQADAEVQAGQRQAEMESMKTAARVAKVRAGFGARGVDVNSGSAVDVQASEREVGKLDAETALSNEQQKAYGYRSRAAGYGAQADLYDISGRGYGASGADARTGGWLSAGGTLLSRASSLPFAKMFGSGASTAPGSGETY